ncbi:hypothetical protein GF378_00010 [Candidatus Pacearchaeota archaeon]|nr:hypothetical protein [Candidatus Pacearchaeota archaeon]
MQKQTWAFIILAVLAFSSINLASAETNEIIVDYTLVEDKALVQIDFGNVSNLKYELPYDARTIESKQNFSLEKNVLQVEESENFSLSYITESVIEKTSNRNFFILKNKFEQPMNLKLILPEKAILDDRNILSPNPDFISTDGRRIILKWNSLNAEEIVVTYEPEQQINIFWIIIAPLILLGIILYQSIALKKKVKKLKKKKKISAKRRKTRKKKNMTRNLYGEEKEIVEYLLGRKKNESWTKEIVRDLGISKVRLSRKLRKLQQKDLIEKIPHGNENRIRLLKKE